MAATSSTAVNLAEVAFAVQDEWQGHGLGTFLLEYLTAIARENGIEGFTALVMDDNVAMLRLFHHAFPALESRLAEGTYEIAIRLDPAPTKSAKAEVSSSNGRPDSGRQGALNGPVAILRPLPFGTPGRIRLEA